MERLSRGPDMVKRDDIYRGIYPVRTEAFAEAGTKAKLQPAHQDMRKVAVVLIDDQYDFIHPDGKLPVPGALEDTVRFLEWFYANMHQITTVVVTLDTHVPLQIFFASWWRAPRDDANAPDIHPQPYTPIRVEDLEQGRWEPVIEARWSQEYVRTLRKQGKKELMVWPYHCLEGTQGHLLLPPIAEAIVYHSAARMRNPIKLEKARTFRTELYGPFGGEVIDDRDPGSFINTSMLNLIMSHDLVYIAGQARSHCVLEGMKQIFTHFQGQPQLLERLRFLMDCTSSVQHPDIDFDAMANAELQEMAKMGVQLVRSTDPIQ